MLPNSRAAKALLVALALFASLAGLYLYGHSRRPPRLYRLGLVAPFEGLFRADGYEALAAARAREEYWNREFIKHGFQVQVWAVDDSNDPALARERASELAGDPLVLAVVGHLAPETSTAGSSEYEREMLLQVSPGPFAGGASSGGVHLSVALPPSTLLAAASDGTAISWLALGEQSLWQVNASSSDSEDITGLNAPLQPFVRYLVESDDQPDALVLPYGYCPQALLLMFPETEFYNIARAGRETVSLADSIGQASDIALAAILAAAEQGNLTREAVSEQALAQAEEGWIAEDGFRYVGGLASILPCPAVNKGD